MDPRPFRLDRLLRVAGRPDLRWFSTRAGYGGPAAAAAGARDEQIAGPGCHGGERSVAAQRQAQGGASPPFGPGALAAEVMVAFGGHHCRRGRAAPGRRRNQENDLSARKAGGWASRFVTKTGGRAPGSPSSFPLLSTAGVGKDWHAMAPALFYRGSHVGPLLRDDGSPSFWAAVASILPAIPELS